MFILMFEVEGPDISPVPKKEIDDYIITILMVVDSKNTTELEHVDEFEKNYMTVYVKTISGKAIRILCEKKQKADTVSKKLKSEQRFLEE